MNPQNLIIDPINPDIYWTKVNSNCSLYNRTCIAIIDEELYSCDLDEIGNIQANSIGKLVKVSLEYADVIKNTFNIDDLQRLNIEIFEEKIAV